MGKYNFDEVIDRHGTDCLKYDFGMKRKGRDDLLPLWVADMDFRLPDEILDEFHKRIDHGIFGYTDPLDEYFAAMNHWFSTRYGYTIEPDWVTLGAGIVYALGTSVRAFTEKGDAMMVMQPVYYPFSEVIKNDGRRLVNCQLRYENNHYSIDFEKMERMILEEGVKALIFCNPHNPVGRVWTREELEAIAEVCADDNVIVLSDEIHADLTLPPRQHLPFPMVSEKARNNSVTFMSPSKAFNMPGVSASHTVIFNEGLRARFEAYLESCELNGGHVFAFPAVEAAYSNGTEWLEQLLSYIQGNIDYVTDYIHTHMPKIKVIVPMASYLVWLDCRDLKLSQEALNDWFVSKAHLALNDGKTFGKEGIGFMRMNIGSPRSILEQAMKQLHSAYQQLPE